MSVNMAAHAMGLQDRLGECVVNQCNDLCILKKRRRLMAGGESNANLLMSAQLTLFVLKSRYHTLCKRVLRGFQQRHH